MQWGAAMRRLHCEYPSSLLINEKTIVRHDFLHALSDLNYFRLPDGRWRDDVIRNLADMPNSEKRPGTQENSKEAARDRHLS
jgi:hypothetical protein